MSDLTSLTSFPEITHLANSSALARDLADPGPSPGAGPAMARVRTLVECVARVDLPVLLVGEAGVGKTTCARLLHQLSSRSFRPFGKVTCATYSVDLLETELFGDGAAPDSARSRSGQLQRCHKGTLLLEKVEELPPALQEKLLEVLVSRQFSRQRGAKPVAVDVRILAAAEENVERAVETRKVREDLYKRLCALTLRLPPLRERKDEIPALLEGLMRKLALRRGSPPRAFSPWVVEECKRYDWPGNLRELENFVQHYLVIGNEESLLRELSQRSRDWSRKDLPSASRTSAQPPVRTRKAPITLGLFPVPYAWKAAD